MRIVSAVFLPETVSLYKMVFVYLSRPPFIYTASDGAQRRSKYGWILGGQFTALFLRISCSCCKMGIIANFKVL